MFSRQAEISAYPKKGIMCLDWHHVARQAICRHYKCWLVDIFTRHILKAVGTFLGENSQPRLDS
jgi:hypothetical protein